MKMLVWNCRGGGNSVFKRTLRELLKNHNPTIIVLMETKVSLSSMGPFFNNLSFTTSTFVDPVGKCGGLWLLWDPFKMTVMALDANPQVIYAKIKCDHFLNWILSAVYANPNPKNRDTLWDNLESMDDNIHAKTKKFAAKLNRCNLMDLSCSGPHLTWTNGHQDMANTLERLDRATRNTE
ncbi:hypothetical protein ACSBR1_033598 [Camellia fascicularis]